jgi:IS30 family transposase
MPNKKKARKPKSDPVVAELDAIKRLLILQLKISGVASRDIASALNVHESVVSRLFGTRKVKRLSSR